MKDGAVRQHDLRVPHQCGRTGCPQPLVELPFDLSTLALSPLAPYHFVVAGESQYVSACLHDLGFRLFQCHGLHRILGLSI